MESYSYTYPESGNSSPRSREIDCENASWDEPANYKVKFMCSYGGKISPRPHDNQLSYVGGDTKILTVDRNIRFHSMMSKLSGLVDSPDYCFKYQLPGEDLDALISVTNDEDLDHMMLEYDRLHRLSAKPARLRLFLFPVSNAPFPAPETKTDRQWFVEALNSAPPIQAIEVPSPPAPASGPPSATSNPDFLFGFDKAAKMQEAPAEMPPSHPAPLPVRSEPDRQISGGMGDAITTAELQRQIHELQRLQIQEQQHQQQARAFAADYFTQKPPEKPAPLQPPSAAPMPVPVPIPTTYWPERQMQAPPAPVTIPTSGASAADQPVYLVPTSVYRPSVGAGQGYYVQRMMPEVYREQPPPAVYGVAQPPAAQKLPDPVPGAGYTGLAYDNVGRQVYYTSAPGGPVAAPYPTDARQVSAGPVLNQEGKVPIPKHTQPA